LLPINGHDMKKIAAEINLCLTGRKTKYYLKYAASKIIRCWMATWFIRGLSYLQTSVGARGTVVVKALCCTPEGRGFETQ
jgi:hypothetical protein